MGILGHRRYSRTAKEKWPLSNLRLVRAPPRRDGPSLTSAPSPETGKFLISEIRLGSRGDSYYEYLPKMFIQTNRTQGVYKEMHDQAMTGVKDHLIKYSPIKNQLYTSELQPRRDPKTRQVCVVRSASSVSLAD